MKRFKFEIQGLITVTLEGKDKDDARIRLINNLQDYGEMMARDADVSDGIEVK